MSSINAIEHCIVPYIGKLSSPRNPGSKRLIKVRKFREQIVQNKKLAHVSNRLVIGIRGRIQPGMNGLQIKLSTNLTFTAENPYNLPLYSMPSDELNLVRQS